VPQPVHHLSTPNRVLKRKGTSSRDRHAGARGIREGENDCPMIVKSRCDRIVWSQKLSRG
jgi:hypothetical protein